MLDKVSDEEITQFNIPTGIPLAYELDDDLKPISSEFLGDPEHILQSDGPPPHMSEQPDP